MCAPQTSGCWARTGTTGEQPPILRLLRDRAEQVPELWPIRGGEEFRLTFSIHDEGDAVFDSLVLLDNFRWHDFEAVGATDPLN